MPRLVCISDTHGRHDFEVPTGDILVHAGDLTSRGSLPEIEREAEWLRSQPHADKIVIAGNHDFGFECEPEAARALFAGLDYLEDSGVTRQGLSFWGSPWQPVFFDWAFNLPRGAPLRAKWAQIPSDLDVLVVHGPPAGHGDRLWSGERVGCADLTEAVRSKHPRLVVCGHIHEDPGRTEAGDTWIVNASTCDRRYHPTQPPVVVDLEPGSG